MTANQRNGQSEARSLAGLAPCVETPLVQPGVLDADRKTEPGATRPTEPRRIRPPEAVEHQLFFTGAQPDALVAHRDRNGVAVGAHGERDGFAFAMVDGVREQIAQNTFHTTRVDLGDDGFGR